jgi:hypothetical protein
MRILEIIFLAHIIVASTDFIKCFGKSYQIHLTAVNVSRNIKIAQIARNDYLPSIATV